MDDDWAYAIMLKTLKSLHGSPDPFVPGRSVVIGSKSLQIGLDNGNSYGNIVSARYASFSTVQTHIHSSLLQITIAHRLSQRKTEPALFVVLPEPTTSAEVVTAKKTSDLLNEVEDAGVAQFCSNDPADVAFKIREWALAA